MTYAIRRLTDGPKHHLFGFHDLVQTNYGENMALCLEVDDISRPPLPGECCQAGVVDIKTGRFCALHTTRCWNYPQGARQQWLGNSNICLCNDREDDGSLICRVFDAGKLTEIKTLPFPVHCVNAEKQRTVAINYDRLFSVGGYGYTPLKGRNVRLKDIPVDDGLWAGDLCTGKQVLLASIMQIASCGEKAPVRTGFPHYITHPLLNPCGTRVAFLHRYRLPDGGETTRLLTIGLDGGGLRCLAKGFLSHFTWVGDKEILIWGAHQPRVFALREARYLGIPGVLQGAKIAKCLLKRLCWHKSPGDTSAVGREKSFLLIKDSDAATIEGCAVGIITEDGHPMANPKDLRKIVSDTYPDMNGNRQLYLYDLNHEDKEVVLSVRRIFDSPDKRRFSVRDVQAGTDPRILKNFNTERYLFARSGFHCDLHPRWSFDGRTVFFDSIHEGTRQIYSVEV